MVNKNDIDRQKLKFFCNAPIKKFSKFGNVVKKDNSFYIFQNNKADILAVSHLDTVQINKTFFSIKNRIYNPKLDDRLGAYTILSLLPKFGVKADVLLTIDEEFGNSSAKYFETNKEYNWIFEFDRGGTDVALYKYENKKSKQLMNDFNFKVGRGVYTDICELYDLGCLGFNFGTAYYNYHNVSAYMEVNQYIDSVNKFLNFYDTNKNKYFEFDYIDYIDHFEYDDHDVCYNGNYDHSNWNSKKSYELPYCLFCGEDLQYAIELRDEICIKCRHDKNVEGSNIERFNYWL